MFKKLKVILGITVSAIIATLCGLTASAYGEVDSASAYYTISNGVVYDQYNSQVCSVDDNEWQNWINQLHTEVIRDTLTGAAVWEEGNCTGGTVVLNKWGQLLCELPGLTEKEGFYEFSIEDSLKTFKLTESTVEWLKEDLCADLKSAIVEGFVPYTYNVYVPYISEMTCINTLDLTSCATDFSYTIHPVLGVTDNLYLGETSDIYVLNLGGRYGVTINDTYLVQVTTLMDKEIYVTRDDVQSLNTTYVKDGTDKELRANAVIAARIPLKAPLSGTALNGVYVDMAKKTLVNNDRPMLLTSIGLDLSNFYTLEGFVYSNKYKEVITNGVNTLPTGDFLTLAHPIEIQSLSGDKNPAYPVEYVTNSSGTIDIVVNTYGLCMIIPSANINFEKLLVSLGTEKVIQNLGADNVKNGSVFELAKSIYQGLGGDKATWDSYMVTAGFQEAEGFDFTIIIFILIAAAVIVGVIFLVRKVNKELATRKEIENSYTNVLTGNTTKIKNTEETDEKTDKKKAGKDKKAVKSKKVDKAEKSDEVEKSDETEKAAESEKVSEVQEDKETKVKLEKETTEVNNDETSDVSEDTE